MWLLKKLSDGTTKYLISDNKSYTVGRKNCDIILQEDASISRKHCSIYIAKQSECPFTVSTLTGVWVVDEQSKYGTYINNNNEWIRINTNQNKKLNNGSVIKFGLMENVWSLEYKPLVVCVSGLTTEEKKKISSSLQLIDGCLKNAWCKECSLVVVNEVILTAKVVLALIHGIPIVTPAYLQEIVESVKNCLPFPKFEDYRPVIKEILLDKSLVSLDIKENRKTLFSGKKFIIPTKKQLETLNEIITSAGGSTELLSCNERVEKFAEDNVVVIQLPFNNDGIPDELSKSVKEITAFLKNKHKMRVVPECEIAQAVAYASTEKYCNPKSTWFNIKMGERKTFDLGPVIVEETPLATEETRHSPLGIVPSSATMESEPLFQTTTKPQAYSHKSQSRQEPEISFLDRKRIHSPDHPNEESQIKKARNESSSSKGNQTLSDAPSLQGKGSLNKIESKSTQSKKNQTKSSYITNYFQKQNKASEEVSQNGEFWDSNLLNNHQMKRKISTESEESDENSSRKKAKLPKEKVSKPKTLEAEHRDIEDVLPSKSSEKSLSFPPVEKIQNFREDNDFTGFFEKEKTEPVDELNNTLFSLTLISPAYLKEDGSLTDPPIVPVNVKKFKKQKIISLELSLEENEDKLLEGEWIEPHSNQHNISVG